MKQIISVLILIFLLTSCYQKQNDDNSYSYIEGAEEIIPITEQRASPPPPPLPPINSQEVIKKKIIKDGRLGLKVQDLKSTKICIDTLLKKYGGYYANENFTNKEWQSSYNLNIRIPSINFEKFITDLETGEGIILYKGIDARDVTDQFIDLETRLANKQQYLKRYNELLKQAKSVKEILDIEERIREIEEESESTIGRLKYLNDQVDYSTLDLTITKEKDFKYSPTTRDKFSERLKQSLSKGWLGFVDFSLFLIKIWPFWIFVTLILYLWKKLRIGKKRN